MRKKKSHLDSGLMISKCQAIKGEQHNYVALLLRITKWSFMLSAGSDYRKYSFQGVAMCKMQPINLGVDHVGKTPHLPENPQFQECLWSGLRSVLSYSGYDDCYNSVQLFLSWGMWALLHWRRGNHSDSRQPKTWPTVFKCLVLVCVLKVADCIWRSLCLVLWTQEDIWQ